MGFLVKFIKLILPADGLGGQPVYRRTINVEKVMATEFKSNHGDALRPGLKIQSTKMSWCIQFSGIIVGLLNQEAIG